MLVRSGSSSSGWEQFHRQAPQWTHFSRSNAGTPPAGPGVMAWPEQTSTQIWVPQLSHSDRVQKRDVVGVARRRLHLAAHQQRVLLR